MSTIAKRIAFHTLGCKLNFSETSTLSRDSLKYGYENVDSKEFADIYVFNTCSVTENANKETRKLIRRSKRINPNAFITLVGCYAQLKPEELTNIEDVKNYRRIGADHVSISTVWFQPWKAWNIIKSRHNLFD